ncbi:MAG: calcium-binding protein [Actinobacteria bacterium]|nr:calcium-binding protein [Actinomycetota bacterium]
MILIAKNEWRRRNLVAAAVGALLIAALLPSTMPALASETITSPPKCTITGTQGADQLNGTAGNDVMCGLGGNDLLAGRGGNDVLIGGLGNDQLSGEVGRDTLIGGPGNDVLMGGIDNDQLKGEIGRDTLIGGSGNDVLIGGADNDQLSGELGRDMLMGDSGNDSLAGGAQGDSFAGGAGTDTITAGTAGDTCATDAADVIRGACQNDLTGPVISEVAVLPVVNAGTVLAFSWRVSDSSGLHISDAYTPTTWVKIGGANGWIGWCGFPIYARQVVLSDVTVSAPTFAAGDAITIEWNATDESGVSGSIPWAFGPNGFLVNLASGQLWLEYGLGTLISGTEFDGRYRITLQLSASAIPGTYSLWFSTNDVLGNHSYAPVSVTFTVR